MPTGIVIEPWSSCSVTEPAPRAPLATKVADVSPAASAVVASPSVAGAGCAVPQATGSPAKAVRRSGATDSPSELTRNPAVIAALVPPKGMSSGSTAAVSVSHGLGTPAGASTTAHPAVFGPVGQPHQLSEASEPALAVTAAVLVLPTKRLSWRVSATSAPACTADAAPAPVLSRKVERSTSM